LKRESELVQRYAQIYPDINFPPEEHIFDLVIDATNIFPKEILQEILVKI
jgi:cytidylate kinase